MIRHTCSVDTSRFFSFQTWNHEKQCSRPLHSYAHTVEVCKIYPEADGISNIQKNSIAQYLQRLNLNYCEEGTAGVALIYWTAVMQHLMKCPTHLDQVT